MQLLILILRWFVSKFATAIIITVVVVLLAVALQYVRGAEEKVRDLRATRLQIEQARGAVAELDQQDSKAEHQLAQAQVQLQKIEQKVHSRLSELNELKELKRQEVSQHDAIQAARSTLSELEQEARSMRSRLNWLKQLMEKGQKLINSEYQTEQEQKIERQLALQRRTNAARHKIAAMQEVLAQTRQCWEHQRLGLEDPARAEELARLRGDEATLRAVNEDIYEQAISRDRRRSLHQERIALLEQQDRDQYAQLRAYVVLREQCVAAFRSHRGLIGGLILAVLLGPLAWSALWYYGIARLTELSSPIKFTDARAGTLRFAKSAKNIDHDLSKDGPVTARMEWVQRYPAEAEKNTRMLWSWRAPFTCFAAGLIEMTEILPAKQGAQHVELCAGDDADMQLMRVELHEHPGLILRPSQVIGVAGDIQLRTYWRLFNAHAWVSGALRQIAFSGTGLLYVRGRGGVVVHDIDGECVRVEEARVSGYEGSLQMSTVRTETFWPYFRRRTSLFDFSFSGDGIVLYHKAISAQERRGHTVVGRTIDAVLKTIGKVFGI